MSWERDSNNYWGGRGRSEAPSDHLAEVLSEEGARGVGYHIIITIIFLMSIGKVAINHLVHRD